MNCTACGAEVSAELSSCVSCGATLKATEVSNRIEITMESLDAEPAAPPHVQPVPAQPMYKPAALPPMPVPPYVAPFQGAPPGYAVNPGYYAPQQNSGAGMGLAIASMVLGIVWLYWLGSILAVIFGHIALSQINRSGVQAGAAKGMAIAGVVLGWIGVATLTLVIIAAASANSN